MDTRINLNISQRLVMTPMLQQAIKLLQMSRLELVDLVNQELLENPILEELEDELDPRSDAQDDAKTRDDQLAEQENQPESRELSIDWEDYFTDNPNSLAYHGEYEPDDDQQTYDNILTGTQTLSDYLNWQLQMSSISERDRKIGKCLIGQIDENGYIHDENLSPVPPLNIHATYLKPKQLKEYRSQVITALSHKVNVEFEREYLSKHIEVSDLQSLLSNILLQEYYDELMKAQYDQVLHKFQQLILEDFVQSIALIREIPSDELETLTHIPKASIEEGMATIGSLCQLLRSLLENQSAVLLHESYEGKLEKLSLAPEELYFLEYVLSKLSVDEVAYIISPNHTNLSDKKEKDLQIFLEKLRQSYAHIESLQSHTYFLIQVYHVGVQVVLDQFHSENPGRFQRQLLKLYPFTSHDIRAVAEKMQAQLQQFYAQTSRVTEQEVEQVLGHIQTFTPSGVGARDLKECLTIQAQSLELTDTPVVTMINSYLDELEHKQYATIAEKLEMSLEDVELSQHIIADMSPKPGIDFNQERSEYIIPELYVYKVGDEYEVVLNEDDLPNLKVNTTYKNIILGNPDETQSATRQYVDQKLRSAIWFIRSVEQRKRTIYKVGKSLVKFQREFLDYGISHLKPLVLRDVADDIAMHESTVSRVTTNKYIHTPQGVFELKYFFHSGLETTSGDDISSLAIKKQLRQMIDEENPKKPFSDKTIEKKLKEAGVTIARRTIAKYREDLNIPSSVQRKRQKNIE